MHLLRAAGGALRVGLVEQIAAQEGRGVAYGTDCPNHLLNVPAGKMGAFASDPGHFHRWLTARGFPAGEASFVPRQWYGSYVRAVLDEAETASMGRLVRIHEEARDLEREPDGTWTVHLSHRRRLCARAVVLALGNFAPGDPVLADKRFHTHPHYLRNPWSAETISRLSGPGDMLILGSGLTALDLLQSLRPAKYDGCIHVLSRRGLFPQPHRAGVAPYPPFLHAGSLPGTLRETMQLVRREVRKATAAGSCWRAVVDSLRPVSQTLWARLPRPERSRFLRHVRPHWESHRHRAAPEALAVKEELEREGRLLCHRGRIISITGEPHARSLEVRFLPRFSDTPRTLRVAYVVNCTGPECNYHQLRGSLVVNLFARGLAHPDPLLLGLNTADDGALLDESGGAVPGLFTLGSPRKGGLLETTAVPELRAQAEEIARRLLAHLQSDAVA